MERPGPNTGNRIMEWKNEWKIDRLSEANKKKLKQLYINHADDILIPNTHPCNNYVTDIIFSLICVVFPITTVFTCSSTIIGVESLITRDYWGTHTTQHTSTLRRYLIEISEKLECSSYTPWGCPFVEIFYAFISRSMQHPKFHTTITQNIRRNYKSKFRVT